ncbi:hypothetical protein SEA_IBANTIK_10 [Streptomyces phage Ibantik]|uniref:Uncharacterized protein n=1 Tax=Streptomyces phage Ibantik TaxID=2182397 RepID=A0A2U8UNI7_9CAUD|nr:hypothetical protein QEH36_gp010 [Streptomyces phage Ibantik]AWN05235.1 hypothetical protein SEA_IBANTIK_10 [Streptomyces phage Ibantik]
MNYLADAERRANHWYERYQEERQRANAAVAEAKKSKERELTAIRMMLKYKGFEKAIMDISEAEQNSQDYEEFGDRVIAVLRSLGYECV